MVFHVENARYVIGALEIYANARETIGVVAQHGPIGRAIIAQRRSHDPAQKSRKLLARRPAFVPMLQFKPDAVDRVPHFSRERGADGALDCGLHGRNAFHSSKTQVSLVPPPWLELTINDPCSSATRVSPPGIIRTPSRPLSTNGRKSTWRGASPSPVQVGQVDSASVGCAMKLCGVDLSLPRNAAIVALSALGPINMP